MIENDLVMALEIVTEGPRARAPRDASRVLFAMESFRRETAKVEEKARSWALAEGVQGLGLGQKVTEGRATEELALRVYVDRKQPVAKLTNPVPKRVLLPELGEHAEIFQRCGIADGVASRRDIAQETPHDLA